MSTPSSYSIKAAQLSAFCPALPQATVSILVDSINAAMARFQIDQSPRRVRYFMAQTCFETARYTSFSENLMYTTAQRLVAVWPTRFTLQAPLQPSVSYVQTGLAYAPNYINNPEALANLVYANRMGNGGVESGDGWLFHGRGAIQLTGRAAYAAYDKAVYGDGRILANPNLVSNIKDAMLSAAWFWGSNGLNAQADADAFTRATQIINGSTVTVAQRLAVLNLANSTFVW
jgi:putative chitinase